MFASTTAFLADAAQQSPMGFNQLLVPLACFGVIFYFGILRPQKKKQDEQSRLMGSLKTGDKVVTTGGIHGIVANVKDGSTLSLKIADNVKIEVDKSAIATIEGATSAAKETPAKVTA